MPRHLHGNIDYTIPQAKSATNIDYNNSTSGLSANNVQNAIDELLDNAGVLEVLKGVMSNTLNTDVYLPVSNYGSYDYISIETVYVTHTNGNRYARGIGYTDVKAMYIGGNVRVQTSENAFLNGAIDVVIRKYKVNN